MSVSTSPLSEVFAAEVQCRMPAQDGAQFEEAKTIGFRWAAQDCALDIHAEPRDLRLLKKFLDGTVPRGGLEGYFTLRQTALSRAGDVFFAIYPDATRRDLQEFWLTLLGDEHPSAEALQGFVEGALEAWQQVAQR